MQLKGSGLGLFACFTVNIHYIIDFNSINNGECLAIGMVMTMGGCIVIFTVMCFVCKVYGLFIHGKSSQLVWLCHLFVYRLMTRNRVYR